MLLLSAFSWILIAVGAVVLVVAIGIKVKGG